MKEVLNVPRSDVSVQGSGVDDGNEIDSIVINPVEAIKDSKSDDGGELCVSGSSESDDGSMEAPVLSEIAQDLTKEMEQQKKDTTDKATDNSHKLWLQQGTINSNMISTI